MRVGDFVTELRTLAADFTNLSHDSLQTAEHLAETRILSIAGVRNWGQYIHEGPFESKVLRYAPVGICGSNGTLMDKLPVGRIAAQ